MERDFLGKRLSCSFPKEQIRSRASCTHCCRLQPKLLSDPQACPCIVLSFGCLRLSDRGDTNPRERLSQECLRSATSAQEFHVSGLYLLLHDNTGIGHAPCLRRTLRGKFATHE